MNAASKPDLAHLGDTIRQRRRRLGLTQTALGDRLGWTQERISLLENGRYGLPSLPALSQIAQALNAGLDEILAAVGYDVIPAVPLGRADALAPARKLDNGTLRARQLGTLHRESRRLATGLADVQARIDRAERQMQQVDSLRCQLADRRETVRVLTNAIQEAIAGGRSC